jgi:hypothetical protein
MSAEKKEPVPEEFQKIIKDFINDILITFPEYEHIILKWWAKDFSSLSEEDQNAKMHFLFQHCLKVYPERFFDILYQSGDMFSDSSSINTEFLPGISFKYLIWKCDEISDNTRATIWKYLQLILLSLVGSLKNKDEFGDTAKLFETINEDDFKDKLSETLENMQNLFENSGDGENSNEAGPNGENPLGGNPLGGINMDNLPNADEIHDHITGMLGGKLGQLAKEIAEETAGELNMDMENVTDAKGVFQNLFKNPGKLMGLVKNVGSKLDERIKSGEIKESELYSEATDIMNKMKDMPGMGNIQSMLKQMGMAGGIPNLGKNAKVNVNAMQNQLNKLEKSAKLKENWKIKAEMKHAKKLADQLAEKAAIEARTTAQSNAMSEEELIAFINGDKKPPTSGKKNKGKKEKK